ncbi:MAG TPA: aminotransferase class III-fold pyridoxal phosphate-dependent enzyme, partial [Sulfurovum sp.]|nr:aminotransferase class III-fold pyridoxal phosphate-dependent enzyme [Sulfurovum sp.]
IQQSVVAAAFDEGLIVLKAGRDTVRFLPPLTITKKEIIEGFSRFEKVISAI